MSKKLILDEVLIHLGGRALFPALNCEVEPGEIVTIMGASGSGKSTLLAYICGTLDPEFQATGRILLDGEDITYLPPEKRRIGILFQDDLLFPHLSVADNLGFGLPAGLSRDERRAKIAQALTQAGLDGLGDRDPATLSGGQRARVGCMRTLLSDPCALLLDEPFSKLDSALRARFRQFVFDLARARALPVLLVTHDPGDAEAANGKTITFPDCHNLN
ncbi:ATP-binding cassette domain-containing protein [Aestuariispira insulae]|uniref:Putative thiamine transport system ATP-binding protein n=1 Tax=Aestuariispira insulae TaxID=1461337 RepID=A0A3D9HP95_9PROT|nr:ATP-binding cassette domain-containing protein [Aestuariispira insulae]RED51235.1 putative thiamine transport system ATP-binding protein [Aestuariispira insulae]